MERDDHQLPISSLFLPSFCLLPSPNLHPHLIPAPRSQYKMRTGAVLLTAVFSIPMRLGMQQMFNKCLGPRFWLPCSRASFPSPALSLEGGTPLNQKGRGWLHVHSPRHIRTERGRHRDMGMGAGAERQSHGRGQSSEPPTSRVPVMVPHENHHRGRDQQSREGGDLPAPPSPHPARLPQHWVLAIFGQKILPKLGDA